MSPPDFENFKIGIVGVENPSVAVFVNNTVRSRVGGGVAPLSFAPKASPVSAEMPT